MRAWAAFAVVLLVLPSLGARRVQGPVSGVVETTDGTAVEDLVVRLRCAGHELHGASASDYETRIVSTGKRFRFPWAWGGWSPVGCSVRVHHPLYVTSYNKVGDDFANDLGTIRLQSVEDFLRAGPTDPPARSSDPWPKLALHQHLQSTYHYFVLEHPARRRSALARYVPALHDFFERSVAALPTSLHDDNPTIIKLFGQLRRIEDATGWKRPADQLALSESARRGDLARVTALLTAGTEPDPRDANGSAPLHYAAAEGHIEVVRALLDAGAQIDRPRAGAGDTPLLEAVQHHRDGVTLMLLERGADPTYAAWRGTPLQAAAKQNARPRVVDALIEHGAIRNAREPRHVALALVDATRANRVWLLEKLLDAGVSPDASTAPGYTALLLAAKKGHVEAARQLIRAGADVNVSNAAGTTALAMARDDENVELVSLLEAAGAR